MATRKVQIRAHTYIAEIDDPRDPEETRVVRKVARAGDEIELSEAEAARGDALGAFYPTGEDGEPETADADDDSIDFSEAGEDELIEWMEDEEPTAKQVVAAANGDPDIARRLLAAEEALGDPRKNVVKGLGAIINRDQ